MGKKEIWHVQYNIYIEISFKKFTQLWQSFFLISRENI